MSPTVFQIVTMLAAVASAACTFFVVWRAGSWKETEEAQDLLNRMGGAEGRIQTLEIQVKDLPTKADLTRVEAEVKGVAGQVAAVDAGINRLEGYFLQRGVQNA